MSNGLLNDRKNFAKHRNAETVAHALSYDINTYVYIYIYIKSIIYKYMGTILKFRCPLLLRLVAN